MAKLSLLVKASAILAPPALSPEMHIKAWYESPALWLGDSYRVQSALSLAKVRSQPAGAQVFGEGKCSFLDDSEVLTHHGAG